MITGNNHKRAKNNLLESSVLNSFDYILAGSLFRLTLNGSDKYIVISKVIHLSLHLAI